MVLHNDTNKTLATFLGISEKSVSDKINENGTEFKQGEISAIKSRYALSDTEVCDIFLIESVLQDTRQKGEEHGKGIFD